jgi:hypothetical protein
MCCPNLEELNLSNCNQVTDRSITTLASHATKLRKLNLNRCDLVTSVAVSALANAKVDLTALNLSRPLLHKRMWIQDEALLSLLQTTPNLQELRLRNCDLVTDTTIIEMAKACGKNLLALDLR